MKVISEVSAPKAKAPVKKIVKKQISDCSIVNNYNWDKRIAYAICMAESGGNSQTINWNDKHNGCTGSAGLMQIACIHTGGAHELDPVKNMNKAFEIYQRSGWQPWGAYTSGAYKRFL